MSLLSAGQGRKRIGGGDTTQDQYEIKFGFGDQKYVLAKNQDQIKEQRDFVKGEAAQGVSDTQIYAFLGSRSLQQAQLALNTYARDVLMKSQNGTLMVDKRSYKDYSQAFRNGDQNAVNAQRLAVAQLVKGWRQFVSAVTTLQTADANIQADIQTRGEVQYKTKQAISSQQSKIVQYLREQKDNADILGYITGTQSYQQALDALKANYNSQAIAHRANPTQESFKQLVQASGYLTGLTSLAAGSTFVQQNLIGEAATASGYLQAFVAKGKVAQPKSIQQILGLPNAPPVQQVNQQQLIQNAITSLGLRNTNELIAIAGNNNENQQIRQAAQNIIMMRSQLPQLPQQGGQSMIGSNNDVL